MSKPSIIFRLTSATILLLSLALLPRTSIVQAAPTSSTLRGGVVINELLIDLNSTTNHFDTDGNGTAATEEEFTTYLPLVARSPPVEVIVTARGEEIGYPSYFWVYGYVRNLTAEPVYSVTLEVDVTTYPYCQPPGYTERVRVTPALTATLPGQINPFKYDLSLGKACADIGKVRVVAASPIEASGDIYYPLTVVGWEYEGTIVSGTVRNDSSQSLHTARVVVVKLDKCPWREAELDDVMLQPGQETTFRLDYYVSACVDGSLVVVGQGAAQP